MTAFDDLGVIYEPVPKVNTFSRRQYELAGGGLCQCGERVRFDLVYPRNEHLMVCPAVDALVMAMARELEADDPSIVIDALAGGG